MAAPADQCVIPEGERGSNTDDLDGVSTITAPSPASSSKSAVTSTTVFVRDAAYRAEKEARKIAKYSQVKKRNSKKIGPRLKKQQKSAIFLKWLIDTFGLKAQARYACIKCETIKAQCRTQQSASTSAVPSSGLNVIDVAGGRGQLAFYLAAFYSIPVSVIDPASMNLKRFEDLYAKKQESVVRIVRQQRLENASADASSSDDNICVVCNQPTPNAPESASSSPSTTSSTLLPNLHSPVVWLPHLRHFQCMFPSSIALVTYKAYEKPKLAIPDSDEEEHVEDEENSSTCCSFQHSSASGSDAYDALLHSSLQSASLIYGMHADGATEALVDYALKHNKNFAVVPCCVFPNAAPHRRVKRNLVVDPPSQASRKPRAGPSTNTNTNTNTEANLSVDPSSPSIPSSSSQPLPDDVIPVRTYEEFLAYLQAKHPSIQRVDLPFEGRNTVLFMRRESC